MSGVKGVLSKEYYVYIMASSRNGTLYTGMTSDLMQRVWEHKTNVVESFTSQYNIHTLVYYEQHSDVMQAMMSPAVLEN